MDRQLLEEYFDVRTVPLSKNNYSILNYPGCVNLINERNNVNYVGNSDRSIINVQDPNNKDAFFNFVVSEYFAGTLNTGLHPIYDIDQADMKTISSLIYSEIAEYLYCEEKIKQFIEPISIGYIFHSNVISSLEKCVYTGRKQGPFFEVVQSTIDLNEMTLSDVEMATIELNTSDLLPLCSSFGLDSRDLNDSRIKYIQFVNVFKQFYEKLNDISEEFIPTVRNTFLYQKGGVTYLAYLKSYSGEYNYIKTHMIEGAKGVSSIIKCDDVLKIISPVLFMDFPSVIRDIPVKFKHPYQMSESRLNAKVFRMLRPIPDMLDYTGFADLAFENKITHDKFSKEMLNLKKAYNSNVIGPFGKCHPLINIPVIGVGDIMK